MELFAKIRAVSRYGRAEILALLPRSAGHLSRAQTQWLVKLAQAIDWGFLEQTFGAVYTDSRPSFANLKPQACRSMCDIDLAPSVLGWRSPRARHPSRMTRAWHAHGVRSFTIGRSPGRALHPKRMLELGCRPSFGISQPAARHRDGGTAASPSPPWCRCWTQRRASGTLCR